MGKYTAEFPAYLIKYLSALILERPGTAGIRSGFQKKSLRRKPDDGTKQTESCLR